MKKILNILLALCLICFCSGLAYAADNESDRAGNINLSDATGLGPGVSGIAVSANGFVAYSAAAGAGGFLGSGGQIMAVISASGKADKREALYFAARASSDPLDNDDNSVYQMTTGDDVAPTLALVQGELAVNFSTDTTWFVRGGSATATTTTEG